MSKLKVIDVDKMGDVRSLSGRFYRKYEVDEVIAKKDAKILALDAEVFKQKHHAELFLDERNYAETQLRHYKSEADKLLSCLKYLVMGDLIKDCPEKTSIIETIKEYDNGTKNNEKSVMLDAKSTQWRKVSMNIETWKKCCRAYYPNCLFGEDSYGPYAKVPNYDLLLSRYKAISMTEKEFLDNLRCIYLNDAIP